MFISRKAQRIEYKLCQIQLEQETLTMLVKTGLFQENGIDCEVKKTNKQINIKSLPKLLCTGWSQETGHVGELNKLRDLVTTA